MLRAVVIDDEPPARRALATLIAGQPDLRLVGQAGDLAQAVALIQSKRPDVAFLDIELGAGSGFSLLKALPQAPHIVVVTAHSQHAPAAFDVAAVDFLLKPVLASRFASTVRRLRALHRDAAPPAGRSSGPQLQVSTGRGLRLIDQDRIVALRAERDFTRLSIAGEPGLLLSRSLGSLVAKLPSPPFLRLSRSLVINQTRIREIDIIDRDHTELLMDGLDDALTLGRSATGALKQNWMPTAAG